MAHTDNDEIVCCICGHKYREARMDGPHKQVHRGFTEKKWVQTPCFFRAGKIYLFRFLSLEKKIRRRQETSWAPCCRLGARQRGKYLHALQAHSIHNAPEKGKPTRSNVPQSQLPLLQFIIKSEQFFYFLNNCSIIVGIVALLCAGHVHQRSSYYRHRVRNLYAFVWTVTIRWVSRKTSRWTFIRINLISDEHFHSIQFLLWTRPRRAPVMRNRITTPPLLTVRQKTIQTTKKSRRKLMTKWVNSFYSNGILIFHIFAKFPSRKRTIFSKRFGTIVERLKRLFYSDMRHLKVATHSFQSHNSIARPKVNMTWAWIRILYIIFFCTIFRTMNFTRTFIEYTNDTGWWVSSLKMCVQFLFC